MAAGPVDGVAGVGELAGEGDGMGAVEVAGPAASWDGRMIRFSTKELTDDIAASARSRAALTSPTYPESRRPNPAKSRRPLNSIIASSAIVRKRMGCRKG